MSTLYQFVSGLIWLSTQRFTLPLHPNDTVRDKLPSTQLVTFCMISVFEDNVMLQHTCQDAPKAEA